MRNNLLIKVLRASLVLAITIFTNEPTVMAQNKAPELVKEVQEHIDQVYNHIESIIFSGRSRINVYIGSEGLGMDLIPQMEEFYFTGMWMKPDSLRLIVKAFRLVDHSRDSVGNNLPPDLPPPNPNLREIYSV